MIRLRRRRGRKSRSKRSDDDQSHADSELKSAKEKAKEKLGAFYAAGPAVELGRGHEESNADSGRDKAEALMAVHGRKETDHVTVYTSSGPISLRGRTDADFRFSYETRNVTTESASGCRNCPDSSCIRARGMLVKRYRVITRVTLPTVSDFPDLSECQQQRVQDAINNVLTPHEQAHVDAFRQYNGTISSEFDLTLCRSEFDSTIRSMAEAEESERRSAAQAASDALDPFRFDVDLDCGDDDDGEK